jgi:hypothetical protein
LDDQEWRGDGEFSQEEGTNSVRKAISVLVAFVCAVVLASCGLHGLPFLPDGPSDSQRMDTQMAKIAAAVNSHDAAALKAMFSPRALEKATDLDARLANLLSIFPNGGLTWTEDASASEGSQAYGTELMKAYYKVSADGVDYSLFFADFTVNEIDPDNVGIYALGVAAWADDRRSGPSEPFFSWAASMTIDESDEEGYPGVYIPPTIRQLGVQKVNLILGFLNDENKDADWLRGRFSEYVQVEYPTGIDDTHVDALLALFPLGDVVLQEDSQIAPVIRETTDKGGRQSLLLSTHRVRSGGADYWLSFAYFTENSGNPDNVGFYAIGVAPRTKSGNSAAEKALFAWADKLDVDASVPPGIFISQ